jgi:hypothetical protein
VAKIAPLSDDDLRVMIDEDLVRAHRAARLTPDRPVLRGTAQNPDVFFQAREACNRSTRLPRHRAGGDGPLRAPHRPPLPAVRLPRPSARRARAGADGLGRGDRA